VKYALCTRVVWHKQQVVACDRSLQTALLKSKCCSHEATPAFVRNFYRGRGSAANTRALTVGTTSKQPSKTNSKNNSSESGSSSSTARAYALFLLRYCLRDLVQSGAYEQLADLPLVPLSDGSHGVFRRVTPMHPDHAQLRAMGFSEGQCIRALAATASVQDAVQWLFAGNDDSAAAAATSSNASSTQRTAAGAAAAVEPFLLVSAEEVALLSGAGGRLICDEALSISVSSSSGSGSGSSATSSSSSSEDADLLRRVLRSAALQAAVNVTNMRYELLPDLVARTLPLEWCNSSSGDSAGSSGDTSVAATGFKWTPGLDGHPTQEWFKALWAYLARRCPRAVEHFAEVCLSI
jgi:UBA/TS-N domain